MRLVNNAFPNFARDDPNDVDLSVVQANNLVRYQLTQTDPRRLGEQSVFMAGITDRSQTSRKVIKALEKNRIISSSPDKAPVDTAGITKHFANQLAWISVHAQRKLVGMLFFWEEECTRWNKLDLEEKEIIKAMDGGDTDNADVELALQAVDIKKKLLPSERADATRNVAAGAGHHLPAYG